MTDQYPIMQETTPNFSDDKGRELEKGHCE